MKLTKTIFYCLIFFMSYGVALSQSTESRDTIKFHSEKVFTSSHLNFLFLEFNQEPSAELKIELNLVLDKYDIASFNDSIYDYGIDNPIYSLDFVFTLDSCGYINGYDPEFQTAQHDFELQLQNEIIQLILYYRWRVRSFIKLPSGDKYFDEIIILLPLNDDYDSFVFRENVEQHYPVFSFKTESGELYFVEYSFGCQ